MSKAFLLQLILAAICGLLISSWLVIFPGYWMLNLQPKLRLPPQLNEDLMEFRNGLNWDRTHKLRDQLFWLAIAKQEIDCLPIHIVCTVLGPVFLIFRRTRFAKPGHNTIKKKD